MEDLIRTMEEIKVTIRKITYEVILENIVNNQQYQGGNRYEDNYDNYDYKDDYRDSNYRDNYNNQRNYKPKSKISDDLLC